MNIKLTLKYITIQRPLRHMVNFIQNPLKLVEQYFITDGGHERKR